MVKELVKVAVAVLALTGCGGGASPDGTETRPRLPGAADIGEEWQPYADHIGQANMHLLLDRESAYRYIYRSVPCNDGSGWCVAAPGEDFRPYSVDIQNGRIADATPQSSVRFTVRNGLNLTALIEMGTQYHAGEYGPTPGMSYKGMQLAPGEERVESFFVHPGYFLTTHMVAREYPSGEVIADSWGGFFVNDVNAGHAIDVVLVGEHPTINQQLAN